MFFGLKQHRFLILQLCWLEFLNRPHLTKVKVSVGLSFFLEMLEENSLSCFFQLLEATCFPWLIAPYSIFTVSSHESSPSHITSLWPPLLPPSSTFKDPCDYIEPIWTIQINLPTSRSTTLITSARRHYYHVSWHSLRSQIPASRMHTSSWTIVLPHIVVSLLSIHLVFNFWCTMDCGTRFPPHPPFPVVSRNHRARYLAFI